MSEIQDMIKEALDEELQEFVGRATTEEEQEAMIKKIKEFFLGGK